MTKEKLEGILKEFSNDLRDIYMSHENGKDLVYRSIATLRIILERP